MKKSELVCDNCRYSRKEDSPTRKHFCIRKAPVGFTADLYRGIQVPHWFSCGEGEWRESKEQGSNEKRTVSHKIYHYDDYDAEEE
jgi:hypothetical protein